MKLSKESEVCRESRYFLTKMNLRSIIEKLDKRSTSNLSKSFSEIDSFTQNKKSNKFPQMKLNENTLLKNIQDIKSKKSSTSKYYQNFRYQGKGKPTRILSKELNCKAKPQNQSFYCGVTGKNICTPIFDETSSINISIGSVKEIIPYKEEFYRGNFILPKLNPKNRADISNVLSQSYIASNSPNKGKRISKSKLISKDAHIFQNESISEAVLLPAKPETPYIRFKDINMRPNLPFSIKMQKPDSEDSEFPSPLTPFGERDLEESHEFVV
jgi:hypothetical protein